MYLWSKVKKMKLEGSGIKTIAKKTEDFKEHGKVYFLPGLWLSSDSN